MDNWRKNRWTIGYGITWAFIVVKALNIIPTVPGATSLHALSQALTLPLELVSVLVTFFIFLVLRHFKESPYILWAVCIFIAADLLLLLSGRHGPFSRLTLVAGMLSTLYYIICLFFVKAPEVSVHFRRLAMADILLLVTSGLYGAYALMHWPYQSTLKLLTSFLQLAPYIAVLFILQAMRRLDSNPMTSIEKDIASIGEPTLD